MRMSAPSSYGQSVAVPLPSDGDIRAVIGKGYDPVIPKRHAHAS
jgi:hypothetical protein